MTDTRFHAQEKYDVRMKRLGFQKIGLWVHKDHYEELKDIAHEMREEAEAKLNAAGDTHKQDALL